MYDSKNYDGFLVEIFFELVDTASVQVSKIWQFYGMHRNSSTKRPHWFFEISRETSNTLKKFKETVKISDCWVFRHYEKKNDGVAWKLLTCFVCVGLSMSEAAALTSEVDALRGKKSPGTEPLKVPLPFTLTIAEWLSRCV